MLFREITDVCYERSRRGRGGEVKARISHPNFCKINEIEKRRKYIKYYVVLRIKILLEIFPLCVSIYRPAVLGRPTAILFKALRISL
jgi:hypothetical protein